MHYNHERAEVGIGPSIGGTHVRDQVSTIINVRYRCAAHFLAPITVAIFAEPVEVASGPDDERNKMTLFGTAVVGGGRVDEAIGDGGRPNRAAS